MNNKNINEVMLIGKVDSGLKFDHMVHGIKFYSMVLNVPRESKYVDRIPVIVSNVILNTNRSYIGEYVLIRGYLRTYDLIQSNNKSKLKLCVCAKHIKFVDEEYMNNNVNNQVVLEGYICKKPTYRTGLKSVRTISDILLAVNRLYNYRSSDYIPCICWNKAADFARLLKVGYHIKIDGRIQSRDYIKYVNGIEEHHTTYEVSVGRLIAIPEEESTKEEEENV